MTIPENVQLSHLEMEHLYIHEEAKKIIVDKLGEKAYPYSVRMAELPKGATLLENPVNKMPAFALDERYYFMPGFPEMSHPMVEEILTNLYQTKEPTIVIHLRHFVKKMYL